MRKEGSSLLPSEIQNCEDATAQRRVQRRAKFQTFEGPTEAAAAAPAVEEREAEGAQPRADEVLPTDLTSAILQSAAAVAQFCNAGGTRAMVELLVPDVELLSEDGAQQRVWDSSRTFLDALKGNLSCENVRAVFPDAGVAALLKHQWGTDVAFAVSSLNDRKPVADEDDAVVLIGPDYQMLEVVERIANSLANEDGLTRPLILWNPRLSSGDVGIGLNVRRMRGIFLRSFATVFYLRPLGIGAIFRCYPGAWFMFLDDPDEPGRYILWRQQGSKPTGDDIEDLYLAASGKLSENEDEGPSMLDTLGSTFASLNRFMRSLSR